MPQKERGEEKYSSGKTRGKLFRGEREGLGLQRKPKRRANLPPREEEEDDDDVRLSISRRN